MKKTKLITLIGVTVLSCLALVTPATTQAATTPQNSTATATLAPLPDAAITLDQVPNITFDQQTVDGTVHNNWQASAVTPNVQVTDPGLASGWDITVFATAFHTDPTVPTSPELKGAQLFFNQGTISDPGSSSSDNQPTANGDNTLITTTATPVLTATAGKGLGIIQYDLANKVYLNVPSDNVAGSYTSTLTWTLTNTPS